MNEEGVVEEKASRALSENLAQLTRVPVEVTVELGRSDRTILQQSSLNQPFSITPSSNGYGSLSSCLFLGSLGRQHPSQLRGGRLNDTSQLSGGGLQQPYKLAA